MKKILYINPLLEEIHFILLVGEEIITKTLPKNLETASTFPKMLVDLVDLYDINDIYCIVGPGPFTLMRVITLAINAIWYTRSIGVKSCHFFDLICDTSIPIIRANPKEFLIKTNNTIENISIELVPNGTYEGIIGSIPSTEGIKYIEYTDNIQHILNVFLPRPYESKIAPLYFKPPHITWQKISI